MRNACHWSNAELPANRRYCKCSRLRLASIQPIFRYLQRFLQGHGEVQLSALGVAISSMVTLAEILKNKQLAVETRIVTSLEEISSDSRSASAPPGVASQSPFCCRLCSASAWQHVAAAIHDRFYRKDFPACVFTLPSGQVYIQEVEQVSVALTPQRIQLQL